MWSLAWLTINPHGSTAASRKHLLTLNRKNKCQGNRPSKPGRVRGFENGAWVTLNALLSTECLFSPSFPITLSCSRGQASISPCCILPLHPAVWPFQIITSSDNDDNKCFQFLPSWSLTNQIDTGGGGGWIYRHFELFSQVLSKWVKMQNGGFEFYSKTVSSRMLAQANLDLETWRMEKYSKSLRLDHCWPKGGGKITCSKRFEPASISFYFYLVNELLCLEAFTSEDKKTHF